MPCSAGRKLLPGRSSPDGARVHEHDGLPLGVFGVVCLLDRVRRWAEVANPPLHQVAARCVVISVLQPFPAQPAIPSRICGHHVGIGCLEQGCRTSSGIVHRGIECKKFHLSGWRRVCSGYGPSAPKPLCRGPCRARALPARQRRVWCPSGNHDDCLGEPPDATEGCHFSGACAWQVGAWGACGTGCGWGVQRRSVSCQSLDPADCPPDRPMDEQGCHATSAALASNLW